MPSVRHEPTTSSEYECSSLALDRGRKKVEDEIGSLETRINYVEDGGLALFRECGGEVLGEKGVLRRARRGHDKLREVEEGKIGLIWMRRMMNLYRKIWKGMVLGNRDSKRCLAKQRKSSKVYGRDGQR
ncbi:hypothetical protein Tco_1466039 [Tanacetum coccineum]